MKTIVITSPHFIAEEINRLYEIYRLGVRAIHIRKPKASEAELELFLDYLLKVVPASCIAVHALTPLTTRRRAITLHLPAALRGFRDRPRSEGRPFSTSAHSLEELNELGARYDYMFLSPIFPSISKPGYAKKWPSGESPRSGSPRCKTSASPARPSWAPCGNHPRGQRLSG